MITYCAAECAEHTGRCSCHCPFACAGPCSRHCLVCAARVDSHCLCRLCCEDTMSKRVSEQESEREQGKKSVCERVRAKQRARGKASAREPSSRSCSHHVTTFASLAGASRFPRGKSSFLSWAVHQKEQRGGLALCAPAIHVSESLVAAP